MKVSENAKCAGCELDAYLAGFFDGEGCVQVYQRKKNSKYIQVIASAYQTLEKPLLLFKRRYGGKVRPNKKRSNRKQSWTWYAYGKDAFFALSRMLPWLIVKKKKAKLALLVLKYQPLKGEKYSETQRAQLQHIIRRHYSDKG